MATSSRCLTQSITATHDFEVTDFSLLDGMGVYKCVSSSTFSVGGCNWKINFYPDGVDGDHSAVYLYLVGGPAAAGVRVKFSFSLLFDKYYEVPGTTEKEKEKEEQRFLKTGAHTLVEAPEEWGWSKFIKKVTLRKWCVVSNSCLCVIKVKTEDADAIEAPQVNLHHDIGRMLKDGEGADVTFKVGDQLFHAHRNLLAARSAVFKSELFGATKEKAADCIVIPDTDPTVFEGLLHFMYTDSLPDDWEADKTVAMQHLLVAAQHYGLYRLRALCEAKLCSWIDVQTVASTLALAEQQQCLQLKYACLSFIGCPHILAAITQTEEFKNLLANFPSVTKEILERVVSSNTE